VAESDKMIGIEDRNKEENKEDVRRDPCKNNCRTCGAFFIAYLREANFCSMYGGSGVPKPGFGCLQRILG
jgi:hypothetical protein